MDSVQNDCIERVVSENGAHILFQRVLTPRPRPNVALRDAWQNSQQQQHQQQQQPRSSESGASSWKQVRTGDQDESRNKVDVLASEAASSRKLVRTDNEVMKLSEKKVDLRTDGVL